MYLKEKAGTGRTTTTGETIVLHIETTNAEPVVVDSSPNDARQPKKDTVATASYNHSAVVGSITILIDTGCLQKNFVRLQIAALFWQDGGTTRG